MSLSRGWSKRAALVVLLTMLLAACSSSGSSKSTGTTSSPTTAGSGQTVDPNGTLRLGYTTAPTSLDPIKAKNPVGDMGYLSPVYDRLLQEDATLKVIPMLATSYKLMDGDMTLEFSLRTDVKFSDGSPFNAAAVVTNLDRARTTAGAASAGALKIITSVAAVDDHTVDLKLSASGVNLPVVLAENPYDMMISPAVLSADAAGLATKPDGGSGPYKFVSATQDTVTYERVPGYWDKTIDSRAPKTLTIQSIADLNAALNALQSGQIDGYPVGTASPNVKALDGAGFKLYSFPSSRLPMVSFNVSRPNMVNPAVRKALNLALDRQAIVTALFAGDCVATTQPFPQGAVGYNADVAAKGVSADPAGAKAMLASAGISGLSLKMVVPAVTLYENIATAVQAQYKAIGVDVSITPVPGAQTLPSWTGGGYDLAILVSPGWADPATQILDYYAGGGKVAGTSLPSVVSAATSAAALPLGSAERDKAYQAIAALLADNPATAPLCFQPLPYLLRSNVIGVEDQSLPREQTAWEPTRLAIAAK